jgi:hypothetical protein
MLTPKKVIPSLAVGMLTLTGTGCGDDSGGTSAALKNALSAFCMKVAECYAETVQECRDYYNDEIFPYYDIDSNCEAAMISYLDCGAALSCDEMMADSNSCDDEFDAIFDVCMSVTP